MTLRLLLCLGVAALMGCDGDAASEERRRGAEPPPPLPGDPLEAAVEEVARDRAGHMRPEGDMRRGTLAAGAHQDLVFVLKDPFCYAVVAGGGQGVEALDLLLFDPTGVPVQHDKGAGTRPTLGIAEPLCPPAPGMYRVQVHMREGSGEYALGLYFTD
jgi:hypothetical protein